MIWHRSALLDLTREYYPNICGISMTYAFLDSSTRFIKLFGMYPDCDPYAIDPVRLSAATINNVL